MNYDLTILLLAIVPALLLYCAGSSAFDIHLSA